jgi:UDP-galactopyranose mutase
MTISSEINAIYYAMRLISHRVDISQLRQYQDNAASQEEFTSEERGLALEIISEIQESERTLIQNLSESKIKIHINYLADKVETLANLELSQAGYDLNRADNIIETLRLHSSPLTAQDKNSNKSLGSASENLPSMLQNKVNSPLSHLGEGVGDIFTDIQISHQNSGIVNDEPDLICLSHLRWDFVFQRPQQLMSRCARDRRVFYIEEPIFGEGTLRLNVSQREGGVYVVVPQLPQGEDNDWIADAMQQSIHRLFREFNISDHILWYYTPMAVEWTRGLNPLAVVYDCMDEISAYKHAPRALRGREAELFSRADLVFAGGQSLYEAKREQHPNVYPFPSSIDYAHFAQARKITVSPSDQSHIPPPRIGFFGVIDERFDVELLDGIAAAQTDWQFVLIGPVVKVDESTLPRRANIHYLGSKSYKELPAYIAGWDVAALLFARNKFTRFISPTKTLEYLAAGKPVVSTSIRDVVRPYGELGLVRIADTVEEFIKAVAELGRGDWQAGNAEWLAMVDAFLAKNSWDSTWARMWKLIENVVEQNLIKREADNGIFVPKAVERASIPLASRIPM